MSHTQHINRGCSNGVITEIMNHCEKILILLMWLQLRFDATLRSITIGTRIHYGWSPSTAVQAVRHIKTVQLRSHSPDFKLGILFKNN